LPEYIRDNLTLDDVPWILFYEFQYYERAAHQGEGSADRQQSTMAPDLELLVTFIAASAYKVGHIYTIEQLAYVLKCEDQYLRQLGLIQP